MAERDFFLHHSGCPCDLCLRASAAHRRDYPHGLAWTVLSPEFRQKYLALAAEEQKVSHDRGCPCGREKYEYDECAQGNCPHKPVGQTTQQRTINAQSSYFADLEKKFDAAEKRVATLIETVGLEREEHDLHYRDLQALRLEAEKEAESWKKAFGVVRRAFELHGRRVVKDWNPEQFDQLIELIQQEAGVKE